MPWRLGVNGNHLADLPTPDAALASIVSYLESHAGDPRELDRARKLTTAQLQDDTFIFGEDGVLGVERISSAQYRPEPV